MTNHTTDARNYTKRALDRWMSLPYERKVRAMANPSVLAALILLPHIKELDGLNLAEYKERVRCELELLASGVIAVDMTKRGYRVTRPSKKKE